MRSAAFAKPTFHTLVAFVVFTKRKHFGSAQFRTICGLQIRNVEFIRGSITCTTNLLLDSTEQVNLLLIYHN